MTVRILQGDCRDVLKTLPDESVHCIVTSPPYWGLRDYGVPGQIGLEPNPEEWLAQIVLVFQEAGRILRRDGTLWLNLGDAYGSGTRADRDHSGTTKHGYWNNPAINKRLSSPAKELLGMPWRAALALQAHGWYLRQDIIWHKPNPMPESVTDRCTKAHEYLFLLAKSERYYYDQNAIKEPASENTNPRRAGNGYKTPDGWDTSKGEGGHGSFHRGGREKGRPGYQYKRHLPGNKTHKGATAYENGAEEHRTKAGLVKYAEKMRKLAEAGSGIKNNHSMDEALAVMPDTRNKRSVWTVPTQPYPEAHFATFPPALIEPCILAGCPEGGTVLDPFGGAGTTGLVADRLKRDALLIELNPAYVEMARKRIIDDAPLFAKVTG